MAKLKGQLNSKNTIEVSIISRGPKGEPGRNGRDGVSGSSAYEVWLNEGNRGTEAEFLESLKGESFDDYEKLKHLPQINGVTLTGDKEFFELGALTVSPSEIEDLF